MGTEAAVVPPKGGGENRPKPGDWTGVGCEVNPEKLAGVEGTEEALGLAKAGGDPKVKEEEEEVGVADAVVVVAFLEPPPKDPNKDEDGAVAVFVAGTVALLLLPEELLKKLTVLVPHVTMILQSRSRRRLNR